MQGGTHEETPRPVVSVMDGAPVFFTEGGMGMSVVEGEFVEVEVLELVFGEAQFPRDVGWVDGESIVVFDDERHGEMVK